MGWKSTLEIDRQRAMELMIEYIHKSTNEQLASALESIGYGDEMELPYYGYNFIVRDKEEDCHNEHLHL